MHIRQPLLVVLAVLVVYTSQSNANVETDENVLIDDELNGLVIELPNGKIRGRDQGHFYSYESIPYAEPPVGALRFESPQALTRKWSGVLDATKAPELCMQWSQYIETDDKLVGVEDCLTVNVYRPKVKGSSIPVLVLIHGGAFMFGSVQENGHERIMQSGQVIVIKMTYRLGPLGFLSTEDGVLPGNYGLKDQRLALQWIKENVIHFGGDPKAMLVMGFSAGAAAVHLQMLQPEFSNYASVAAALSGTALNPWVVQRDARARAFELGKHLNCTSDCPAQLKQCLRERPAQEIASAVREFLVFGYNPFTTFGPVVELAEVEGAFLTRTPEEIIRSGEFAQVPLLLSYSAQDGGYNAAELLQRNERGVELIEELNERWFELAPLKFFYKNSASSEDQIHARSRLLKERYLGDRNVSVANYWDVQRMHTDILFKDGAERSVRLHRTHGTSPVYAFVYDNPADVGIGTALARRTDIKLGTNHGDDFALIFHNPVRNKDLRADEQIISEKFIKMLENFVQHNGELSFGSCRFVNNVSEDELQLMVITQNACENQKVSTFP